MAVTQPQRIMDLALSGWLRSEIAGALDVDVSVVDAAVADLTSAPSGQRNTPTTPVESAPALVSGTAVQNVSGFSLDVYSVITPHAGGSVSVAIGPDNTTAYTIISADDATLAKTVRFRVPPGWYYKVTVAGLAAIASTIAIAGA